MPAKIPPHIFTPAKTTSSPQAPPQTGSKVHAPLTPAKPTIINSAKTAQPLKPAFAASPAKVPSGWSPAKPSVSPSQVKRPVVPSQAPKGGPVQPTSKPLTGGKATPIDHPAHVATQLATTVHTQNHLNQLQQVISQASQKNSEKIAHAATNLEQINPAAANALKAAISLHAAQAGILSHLPTSSTAALKAATKQAAGALSQISPTAATIFNAAGPLLDSTDATVSSTTAAPTIATTTAPAIDGTPSISDPANSTGLAATETAPLSTSASEPVPVLGNDQTGTGDTGEASAGTAIGQAPNGVSESAPTGGQTLNDATNAPTGSGAPLASVNGTAPLTNGFTDTSTNGAEHAGSTGLEGTHDQEEKAVLNGQEAHGGATSEALENEATVIAPTISPFSDEDKIAVVDKEASEGPIEGSLAQFDDSTGAEADVTIVTPTHTIRCHMSKLQSVAFFKEVADAAQAQDPPLPGPIKYKFVVVGGETWSLQPWSSHPTADTRGWDSLSEESKQAINTGLDLFLKVSYGKHPALATYADLDELYATLKAFGMDVTTMNDVITACLTKSKASLGNDIVEYPAAFLSIAHELNNRLLYLDALSHVVGRMIFHNMTWDAITVHYPELADMEAIATKYSAALKGRVETLIALMGEYVWPSVTSTFSTQSPRAQFSRLRDPAPEMIRPELTIAKLISAMKVYRDYMSNELGRNGRGGGYTILSGRDAKGANRKLEYFTELPIKERDDDTKDTGVTFAEFTTDFAHLT